MNSITNFLAANWERLSLQQFGRPPLSALALTPGFRASSNVILLLFPQGHATPALVAKVSRLPGENSELRSEADNLRRVQQTRSGGFDSIPRLITSSSENDHAFLVETMLTGSLMNPAAVRQAQGTCTEAVLNWLIDLGTSTSIPGSLDEAWFARLVAEPTDHLRSAFPQEEHRLALGWDVVAALGTCDLPLVFEHGDLSDPNLLTQSNGKIGVVDWELAQANSLPLVDLFFFLTYVAFSRRRATNAAQYLAAFHEAFFGPGAWAVPYVQRYAHSLEIPQQALTPLFILCWIRYLAKLTRRLNPGKHGELPSETLAWLRANRYYALWKYSVEQAQQLTWSQTANS